ncbi:hypothetical protein EA004_19430 [Vibrio anguillarum]|uniref:Uncharacterized protein n=1 Tax=Vibrio anguillarum TaxID=55601 RepID=A0ABR9Z9I4_VIBAN|nr:hypothetical protein [Vibrio anguillarum]ELU8559322.1 hypothetical protein [Vibrio cholerae]MBF4247151.1 hypothetical protein [Vibrio anguillarum]MBF4374922.1 hypothetical protein [Vibrio anguillarum]HCM0916354.1 hypothetical protein [Vibrio parahaemolyticus]
MSKIYLLIQSCFTKKNDDFASKVLVRYSSQKGISTFSSQLFKSENADTINARFEKTKLKVIE